MLLAVLGLLIGASEISGVRVMADWINLNRGWLLPVTLGATVLGFVLLLCGFTLVGIRYGQPLSEAESDRLAARVQILGPGPKYSKASFRGWRRGRKVDPPLEWSFHDMKAAWHASTWWRDPDMRQKYSITAGGLLAILGGFSVFMVLARPPAVKLLVAGTFVYALTRTVIALRRA